MRTYYICFLVMLALRHLNLGASSSTWFRRNKFLLISVKLFHRQFGLCRNNCLDIIDYLCLIRQDSCNEANCKSHVLRRTRYLCRTDANRNREWVGALCVLHSSAIVATHSIRAHHELRLWVYIFTCAKLNQQIECWLKLVSVLHCVPDF